MTTPLRYLPLSLTLLRAALGPVVLMLAWWAPSPAAMGTCLILAFLSDVFDGIIARRLGIATAGLRRLDSVADTIFYISAALAAWHLHPEILELHGRALVCLTALEVARYALDWMKYRREASYHMWSSKLWGIALFVGFYALLVHGQTGALFAIALYAGLLSDTEGLLISCVLPVWQHDVPSIWHAWALRRRLRAKTALRQQ